MNLTYSRSVYSFDLGSVSTTHVPTVSSLLSCAVSPALPAGLALESSSCEIWGTPTQLSTLRTYTVTATASFGLSVVRTIGLEVVSTLPAIAYPVSSSGSINTFFSVQPTSTGGAIVGCSISPALPAGLTLDPTSCDIAGTPQSPRVETTYLVTASNSSGSGAPAAFVLTVHNLVPVISYQGSPYALNVGQFDSFDLTSAAGGEIEECSISPALPSGLVFDTLTCGISGTPQALSAEATYSVVASNDIGDSVAATFDLSVVDLPPSLAYSSSSFSFDWGHVGSSTGVPVNSGGPIDTCSISPALPAGLSLDQNTCEISGTPTLVSAATSYTISASNAFGDAPDAFLQISVDNIVPSISYASSTVTFQQNQAIAALVATNSGGNISSCSVSPALPAGLSLNSSTCEISGTPTVAVSATTHLITASNEAGDSVDQSLEIEVEPEVTGYSIGGTMTLTSFVGDPATVQVVVKIKALNGTVVEEVTTYLGADSSYSVTGLVPGIYNVEVKGVNRFMRKTILAVDITNGSVSNAGGTMKNGDSNGDNICNLTDYSMLNYSAGTVPGDANWHVRADFNGDNAVTQADADIFSAHMYQQGDAIAPVQ